eukprot:scaffold2149_cov172-Amphora_coffeaeformis.AAC.2
MACQFTGFTSDIVCGWHATPSRGPITMRSLRSNGAIPRVAMLGSGRMKISLKSLYQYPRLSAMPPHILVLLVLFALFIFFCGAGHMMRCLEMTNTHTFNMLNTCTAIISLATSLYLLPLVPSLMSSLDEGLESLKHLNEELEASKCKLMTFMAVSAQRAVGGLRLSINYL